MAGDKRKVAADEFKNLVNQRIKDLRDPAADGLSPSVSLVPVGHPSVRYILLGEAADKDLVNQAYDLVNSKFEPEHPLCLFFWPE